MPTISQDTFDPNKLDTPDYFPHYAYREPANLELLRELGPIITCSTGHVISAHGNSNYCYMVQSGIMAATLQGLDDFSRQSALFLEGSLFLEPSALSGLPSNIAYRAVQPSTLMRIDRDDLRAAMTRNPDIFETVLRAITMKLNAAHEQLRESTTLDVRARIYFMLLGIAETCSEDEGDGWHTITIRLTQQNMSDMLGVNRVTVNTALRDLYGKGVVRKQGSLYSVHDANGILHARRNDGLR